MTRLALVVVSLLSLSLSLSSLASADRAYVPERPEAGAPAVRFAQAPADVLDRATVRAALARTRAANLAAFRAYEKQGVFPSNTFGDKTLNVWRDEGGHLCAAATIINASGARDLVRRVAEQNNFIRLADVSQGPLFDWILTSGFTQDELVAIQRPFMPVTRPSQPTVVAPDLRTAETTRLRALYVRIDKQIVANERQSLDAATDRLMKHPELAWQMIAAQPSS